MTGEPTPHERFILIRLGEGKTYAEIAAELRVPESTLNSRCQQMRARGLDATSLAVRPDHGLAFIAAWNDASLSNDQLAERLGLSWERLREAATRLRKRGHVLIARKRPPAPKPERPGPKPQAVEAPKPPEPGRSIGAAVDILLRQKRDVRFRGELIYLDGRLVSSIELFDQAYGRPQGKWR